MKTRISVRRGWNGLEVLAEREVVVEYNGVQARIVLYDVATAKEATVDEIEKIAHELSQKVENDSKKAEYIANDLLARIMQTGFDFDADSIESVLWRRIGEQITTRIDSLSVRLPNEPEDEEDP